MSPRPARSGRTGRRLLISAAIVLAGIPILGILLGNGLASLRERRLDRAWSATAQSLTEFARSLPRVETNDSARRLEELAGRLGVDLTPPRSAEDPKAPSGDRETLRRLRTTLRDYVEAQIRSGDDRVDEPPAELLAYLEAKRTDVDEVVRYLETAEPALWIQNPDALWDAPLPNLLGQVELQRILLSEALVAIRRGDESRAGRMLSAGWTLRSSVAERPELASLLIAWAVMRTHAGVLRKTRVDPELWRRNYAADSPRKALERSLEYQAWVDVAEARLGMPGVGNERYAFIRYVFRPAFRPFARFSMAEKAEGVRAILEAMRRANLCSVDEVAAAAIWKPRLSRWNFVGRRAWPDFAIAIDRVARLELDRELTLLVAAARIPGAASDRRIPSADCPSASWAERPAGEGAWTIAFEGESPSWPSRMGTVLPLSHRFLASPAAAGAAGSIAR